MVRIVSGQVRGRRLKIPSGPLRPTSGRVKTSLFDILAAWIGGRTVVDLCAGTGSLGIEALSRGAASAVFVDDDPGAVRAIKTNLEVLEDQAAVWHTDAAAALKHLSQCSCPVDLIIADPPYNGSFINEIVHAVATLPVLTDDGLLIIEHSAKSEPPVADSGLVQTRQKKYGNTALTFYQRDEQDRLTSPRFASVTRPVDLQPPSPRKRR